MDAVRVRFAPSPTGFLHVGGARTALFNYLFARRHGGVFVLRIEDTDMARSTEASLAGILEGLQFLGMDWDEGPQKGGDYGPYVQTQRLDLYRVYAEKLRHEGLAYECFCTADELAAMRELARKEKRDPKYDGRCRQLPAAEVERLKSLNHPFVLRFKSSDEGQTIVEDLIRGSVTFDNRQLDDMVVFKSDGMPTYNFAVVIDDALMKISHVIRGEDHLSNTPRQIQIYQALQFPVPRFAHIPMILGADKTRLSKRHGATSVTQFRDEGYLPEAMVNYLALLGWGYDDSQTVFSRTELFEKFSLERVSKNPAVFDFKKLEWLNGLYIRELPLDDLYQRARPFFLPLAAAALETGAKFDEKAKDVLGLLQSRLKRLDEVPAAAGFFFFDPQHYEDKAVKKGFLKPNTADMLRYLAAELQTCSDFSEASLKPVFAAGMDAFSCKLGDLMQPLRVALTGTTSSPSMYEVLPLLGRETVVRRLNKATAFVDQLGGVDCE